MGMPKQLRDQQAASEAYDKQLKEGQEPPPEPEPAPAPEPPATPEPPAPTSPAPTPPPDDAALWKQRFLSLQGMFNQQVPALQQELKDIKDKLKKVEEAPPTEPVKPDGALVTDKDVTAFGSDLIDVIRRGARDEIAQLTTSYEAKIRTLEDRLAAATQDVTRVAQSQAESAQSRFFESLEGRLPNWEGIQGSAECQNWLGSRAPGATHTWNDLLVGAAERRDVDAVVEVFDEFFKVHPALRPGQPRPQPTQRNKPELERQVTPPKSSASAPTPSATKRVYTSKEYSEESMKVIRLVQNGRRAEADALEAELNAALMENRIRP